MVEEPLTVVSWWSRRHGGGAGDAAAGGDGDHGTLGGGAAGLLGVDLCVGVHGRGCGDCGSGAHLLLPVLFCLAPLHLLLDLHAQPDLLRLP
eukprot:108598-Pyramimonas_sp.AAC.2